MVNNENIYGLQYGLRMELILELLTLMMVFLYFFKKVLLGMEIMYVIP